MADIQAPGNGSDGQPLPTTSHGKLGETLALSHLSGLPELPTDNAEDYRLQQLQYAMHLDSSMLTYTPAAGRLKNVDPQQANRFDEDTAATKRKIYVNTEVRPAQDLWSFK